MKRYLALLVVFVMLFSPYVSRCSARSVPVDALDVDGNNDGVVDAVDVLMAARVATGVDGYNRKFDITFKGTIDMLDVLWIAQYAQTNPNLLAIGNNILTAISVPLMWPDQWTASLRILRDNPALVQTFTGMTKGYGWLHGTKHPALSHSPEYMCTSFSQDMSLAAYKTLGYGAILFAQSTLHAYNIFFVGGDWHNLYNWRVLEPQNGCIYIAALFQQSEAEAYGTRHIFFYDRIDCYGQINAHVLDVDLANPTSGVTYGTTMIFGRVYTEEHLPDEYIFNSTFNP